MEWRFPLFMVFTILLFSADIWLLSFFGKGQGADIFAVVILAGSLYVWVKVGQWWDTHLRTPRQKPDGYVGKFRRPDGRIVHVMRMDSGKLWAASEERPGVLPESLGYISGREMAGWDKLATSPDGDKGIARPH